MGIRAYGNSDDFRKIKRARSPSVRIELIEEERDELLLTVGRRDALRGKEVFALVRIGKNANNAAGRVGFRLYRKNNSLKRS